MPEKGVSPKGKVLGFGPHFLISQKPERGREGDSLRLSLQQSGDQGAEPPKLLAKQLSLPWETLDA